jgi:hypothetical protein
MAGNTQIDPRTEGGLFSFMHGLVGYAVAVGLMLTILVVTTVMGINVQQEQSTNFYTVNQDLGAIKMNSLENISYRKNQGE